jgi:hypothetical protein
MDFDDPEQIVSNLIIDDPKNVWSPPVSRWNHRNQFMT